MKTARPKPSAGGLPVPPGLFRGIRAGGRPTPGGARACIGALFLGRGWLLFKTDTCTVYGVFFILPFEYYNHKWVFTAMFTKTTIPTCVLPCSLKFKTAQTAISPSPPDNPKGGGRILTLASKSAEVKFRSMALEYQAPLETWIPFLSGTSGGCEGYDGHFIKTWDTLCVDRRREAKARSPKTRAKDPLRWYFEDFLFWGPRPT